MALLPIVLLLPGESLISYMTRLARCRAGMSLIEFLTFLGLRPNTILLPDGPTLDRIAYLSGTERSMLKDAAVSADSTGMRWYRGGPFAAPFRLARMISFCPRCLLEDRACRDTGGRRIGRQIWEFAPIRTCPRHGVALFRRQAERDLEIVDLLEGGVYTAPELQSLADSAIPRAPSALQLYIQSRFGGVKIQEWPDTHRVDQVAACSTLLGACLQHGSGAKMADLDEDQRDAAGACGFDILRGGDAGVFAGLDQILAETQMGPKELSVKAAYGAVYHHMNRDPVLYAPLRPLLRAHILDRMPIAAETTLLGETVEARRRHNIRSLAQEHGLSHIRLAQALHSHGLLQPRGPGKPQCHQIFDAESGEAVADRLKHAIPENAIPERLNCDATTAAALVVEGYAVHIGGPGVAGTRRAKTMDLIEATSLDRLMETLIARVSLSIGEINQPLDMTRAAYRFHWPVGRILRMVFTGVLARIALHPQHTGFTSVMIDEQELERLFHVRPMAACLQKSEAAQMLEVDRAAIDRLIRTPGPNGAPFVRRVTPLLGRNKNVWHLEAASFLPFCDTHLALASVARDLARGLSAAGIEPVLRAPRFEFSLYPRTVF